MIERLTLKRIEEDELEMVQDVYNATREASFHKNFFLKKFVSNCLNKFISVMYFDGKQPVSHCVAIPFNVSSLKDSSTALIGAQVCDAVTVPAYQRNGLFNRLNQKILDISESEKVSFLYRFPSNQNYKRVINNFGFTHLESFQEFEFNFKVLFPLLKVLEKFKLHRFINIYLNILSIVTFSKNKVFENSLISQGFQSVPHNKEYFDYKKYSKNYRLNMFGDNYWVKPGDGLVVGDFKTDTNEKFLKRIKLFCFIFGIHKVKFNVCKNTKEYDLLKNFQDSKDSMAVCVRAVGEAKVDFEKIKFTFAELDTF